MANFQRTLTEVSYYKAKLKNPAISRKDASLPSLLGAVQALPAADHLPPAQAIRTQSIKSGRETHESNFWIKHPLRMPGDCLLGTWMGVIYQRNYQRMFKMTF